MWTTVEINVSIVSACLPTLRPLIKRLAHGKEKKTLPYPTYHSSKSKITNREAIEMSAFEEMEHDDDQKPFAHLRSKGASGTTSSPPSVKKSMDTEEAS